MASGGSRNLLRGGFWGHALGTINSNGRVTDNGDGGVGGGLQNGSGGGGGHVKFYPHEKKGGGGEFLLCTYILIRDAIFPTFVGFPTFLRKMEFFIKNHIKVY